MVKMCHVPLVEAPRCTVDRNPAAMYGHSHNMGLTFWDRKERGADDAQSITAAKISVPDHFIHILLCKKN